MKIKIFTVLAMLIVFSSAFSQSNLNEYKYIIVPNKFDFLREENQYRLNDLTKFLFEKYGFLTLTEGGNYPDDLFNNRCLALKSNVLKESGLFKTKLKVELKNCNDHTVFTSQLGETREKDYGKAYNIALRNAFKSFETIAYKHEPKVDGGAVKEKPVVKVQAPKEEVKELKKIDLVESIPVEAEKLEVPVKKEVIKTEPVVSSASITLYAQAIENGFQLVDNSPKVVYKIKKTSLNMVFMVEGKNGILYQKGDAWILEYYSKGELKQEELNIKF